MRLLKINFIRILSVMVSMSIVALLSACISDDIVLKHTLDYKIVGVSDVPETKKYLDKILEDRLVASVGGDKNEKERQSYETYRVRLIKGSLVKALHSKGYYDAEVLFKNAEQVNAGTYEVNKGDLYTISALSIKPTQFEQHMAALTIKKGSLLSAVPVLKSQEDLYEAIQKGQCYFNLDISHQVVLNRDTKTAKVIYDVEAGSKSVFDEVQFIGQESVDDTYLRKLIPFKKGDCYRREKIEKLREELLATGLFVRSNIKLPALPVNGNKIPLEVELKERAHRTVRIGGTYYTDEGPGVALGWEHRNFLGYAEKLEAQIKASQRQQKISLDLTKPFFLRKDQTLSLTSSLDRQDSDAYDELSIGAGASIKRSFYKILSGGTGVKFKLSRIEDKNTQEKDNYGLLSFPNALTYDNRDNKLNPHRGWYINGIAEPFLDVLGNSDPFFKTRLTASTYFGFQKNTVFAVRASVGNINGADIKDIPASERFYAGGGGSVRGFGYQEVGPVINGDPSGGSSLVEGAAELRFNITDTIGAVAFLDAGNVTDSSSPEFSNFSIGAGVGLRYYSSFGPLRFDVATPITNKDKTDSNYQIYISIGQAF